LGARHFAEQRDEGREVTRLALAACIACTQNGFPDGGVDASMEASIIDVPTDTVSADTGNGSDSSTDTGTFSVLNVNGLAMWFDAAQGITKDGMNQISLWADISGLNHVGQGQTRQPFWVPSVINNLPAVHFDNSNPNGEMIVIPDSPSLHWDVGDFLIEIVARFAASGTLWSMASQQLNNNFGLLVVAGNRSYGSDMSVPPNVGFAGNLATGNRVGVTAMYIDNTARLYAIRRTGTTLEARVNGMVVASSMNPQITCFGSLSRMGRDQIDPSNALQFNGDIAEVVGVNATVSSSDVTSIESYLTSKYKL
jgi:hypothetical protein